MGGVTIGQAERSKQRIRQGAEDGSQGSYEPTDLFTNHCAEDEGPEMATRPRWVKK